MQYVQKGFKVLQVLDEKNMKLYFMIQGKKKKKVYKDVLIRLVIRILIIGV